MQQSTHGMFGPLLSLILLAALWLATSATTPLFGQGFQPVEGPSDSQPTPPARETTTGTPDISKVTGRQSITFFRTHTDDTVNRRLTDAQITFIENYIRRQVEGLARFDKVRPFNYQVRSATEFVRGLQTDLKAKGIDIAKFRSEAAGIDYDFKYRDTIITGDAIRQVLNSAYAYEITLDNLRTDLLKHEYDDVEDDPATGARRPIKRQQRYWTASMNLTVAFFKIKIADEAGNYVPVEQAVVPVAQGSSRFRLEGRAKDYLLEEDSPEYKRIVAKEGEDVAKREAALRRERGEKDAIDACVADVPDGLDVWVRGIPEFKLRDQIVEDAKALKIDRVTIRKGRAEDVKVDDYFEVYDLGERNVKVFRGWAKVRELGPGERKAGDGASMADVKRTQLQPISGRQEAGMMVEEYPMFGVGIDLYFGFDINRGLKIANANNVGNTTNATLGDISGMFIIGLFIGYDLAKVTEIPELWTGLDVSLAIGSGTNVSLLGLDVGLEARKKFYFGQFVFDAGTGGGISIYFTNISGGSSFNSPVFFYSSTKARADWFFTPNFHAFVQVNFRVSSFSSERTISGTTFFGDGFSWKNVFSVHIALGAAFEF